MTRRPVPRPEAAMRGRGRFPRTHPSAPPLPLPTEPKEDQRTVLDTQRDIHVIGTVRAADTKEGMTRLARRFKRRIRTLPTCEVRFPNWVIEPLEDRENNPFFVTSRKSRMSRNDKAGKVLPPLWWPLWEPPRYKAAAGITLTPEMLRLPYAAEAAEAWEVFRGIVGESRIDVRDDLTLQQSVPDPDNMAWFSSWRPWKSGALEADAMLAEVVRIHQLTDNRVTFQWEGPMQTVAIAETPRPLQAKVADKLMRRVCQFIARSPEGSRWVIHFCYGNKADTPIVSPRDAGPLVHAADALIAHWPEGHTLDGITFPFGDRRRPVPVEPKFYLPLRDLALPTGVRPMAGLVRAGVGPWQETLDRHRAALSAVEDTADCGPWVVTSPCGWSRQSEVVTTETMDLHMSLATGADCRTLSPTPR